MYGIYDAVNGFVPMLRPHLLTKLGFMRSYESDSSTMGPTECDPTLIRQTYVYLADIYVA